ILVQPSAHEGLALVLYEAMAMRTVPVAAAVGGQAELVTPDCGVLIPRDEQEKELQHYVATVRQLVEHSTARQAMAAAARARVLEEFSSATMCDVMVQTIAEAIDHASQRDARGVDLSAAHHGACQAVAQIAQAEA